MALSDIEFDIIFAGGTPLLKLFIDVFADFHRRIGGAAACLTAGRLAAADPTLKILIIEAGPHVRDDLAHTQPARYLSHLVPGSKTVKFIVSNPSEHLGGRVTVVPAAQCFGGAASINCELSVLLLESV